MLTTKQDNVRIRAIEHGRRENNFIDCDVVQDAITQLEGYNETSDPKDIRDSISYLGTAIAYRRPKSAGALYCLELLKDFDTPADIRLCKRCGDVLEQNDDLICGYHNLED